MKSGIHIPISQLFDRKYPLLDGVYAYKKHLLNNLNGRVKTIHNFLILLRDSFGAILLARTHIYHIHALRCWHIWQWHGLHAKQIKSLCETENSNGITHIRGVNDMSGRSAKRKGKGESAERKQQRKRILNEEYVQYTHACKAMQSV